MTAHPKSIVAQSYPLSRIAVDAIVAQVSAKADCAGDGFCGDVDGTECTFRAWFSTDWSGPYRDEGDWQDYYEAKCTLLGALGNHPETGADFAGSRAEIEALVGETAIAGWERAQAETEMGQ